MKSDLLLERLRGVIERDGLDAAAARLHLSVGTLARVAAGARCRAVTLMAIEAALASVDSQP